MVVAEQFKTSNYYQMMVETCPEIEKSDPGKIHAKAAPTLTTVITIPTTQQKYLFILMNHITFMGYVYSCDMNDDIVLKILIG